MTKLSQIIDTDAVYQAAVKQLETERAMQPSWPPSQGYYNDVPVPHWPEWVSRINVSPAATETPTAPTQAVSIPGLVSPISVPDARVRTATIAQRWWDSAAPGAVSNAAPATPTGEAQFYVKHHTGQHATGPR